MIKDKQFYFLLDKAFKCERKSFNYNSGNIVYVKSEFRWGYIAIEDKEDYLCVRIYTRKDGNTAEDKVTFPLGWRMLSPPLRAFKKECRIERDKMLEKIEQDAQSAIDKAILDVFPEIVEEQIFGDD